MNYDFFPTAYVTNFDQSSRVLVQFAPPYDANTMRLYSSWSTADNVPTIEVIVFTHKPVEKSCDKIVARWQKAIENERHIGNFFRSMTTVGCNKIEYDRGCMYSEDSLVCPDDLRHYKLKSVDKITLPVALSIKHANFYGVSPHEEATGIRLVFAGKPLHVYETPTLEGFVL